jgi:hypothetical protein
MNKHIAPETESGTGQNEKYDMEAEHSITDESLYERKALKVGGLKLAVLAFSTLGVIYSDIGMLCSPGIVFGAWKGY